MLYYFDLIDGDEYPDNRGVEFGSDAAARQEALLRALDRRDTHQIQQYDEYRHIRVRDQKGRVVCRVPIDR